MHRRHALALLAAAPYAVAGCGRPSTRYDGLATGRYLGPLTVETRLEGGPAFTEGPAVDRDGVVYFTNIPASRILRWDPRARELSVFRENTGQTNGLRFDPQGRLLACEGQAGRITRTDLQTGVSTTLASAFEGLPLEAPNDLDYDNQGRIYFSSRPTDAVPRRGNVNAVYRLDPDGSIHQLLREPDVHMPNGVVISPDNRTLYLIEAHPDAGRNRHIKAYDLLADGSVANPRILIDFYPGRSGDGMCIDAEGNLYVAAGLRALRNTSETLDTRAGIHVISPAGELLDFAETPEDTITNCTFGGDDLQTLYVTSGALLLSARATHPGKASYRPAG
ncbi:MAG: SMP-30/gluconolactonase/LRE family protein [Rhodothermales bacterium]